MKKLNKLLINSEKIMKNEELVTLRGGYGDPCTCLCSDQNTGQWLGYLLSEEGFCPYDCAYAFPSPQYWATGWCWS